MVTGRVTDASVVVGPAIAHYGWGRDDLDALAGAVVAGHIIECGTQATGGNFSGFKEMFRETGFNLNPLGFPIAELEADGSCVITKHPGTGGTVSVDTVTAQLVYEVQSTRYLGPDVTTLLDSVELSQQGTDRVAVSGVRGEAPPADTKVCVNVLGGFRNQAELVLTGLDIDAKADWVRAQVEAAIEGSRPEHVDWSLARTDHEDAATEEAASARLRIVVRDPSPDRVGKGFTAPLIELALASYPGFTVTAPPAAATPYGVYQPFYVPQSEVPHVVHHHDGTVEMVAAAGVSQVRNRRRPQRKSPAQGCDTPGSTRQGEHPWAPSCMRAAATRVATRTSGCGSAKGGRTEPTGCSPPSRRTWSASSLPEAEGLTIEVFSLPNLRAVNILVRGLLGEGVAASARFDPQAKGLGEWVRSRFVEIPEELLS